MTCSVPQVFNKTDDVLGFRCVFKCCIIPAITGMCVLSNDAELCASCHRCPDEEQLIFQPLLSATSALLIELFTWVTYDLRCEGAAVNSCASPLKAAYRGFFSPFAVREQSYLIKGAVLTLHKPAVVFHLQAHEEPV